MSTVWLFAGFAWAARKAAEERGLSPSEWRHVSEVEQIRGLEGPNRNPESRFTLVPVKGSTYLRSSFWNEAKARGF